MSRKLESENEFTRGAIAGSISAAVICLLSECFEWLGLLGHCWLFMAGQPVMEFSHTPLPLAFSFLIHLGVGSFWGVIMAFLFSKVFTDRGYLLKGLLIGLAIFFFHVGFLDTVLKYPATMRGEFFTVFFTFITYLIYGGLTAVILKKLSRPEAAK